MSPTFQQLVDVRSELASSLLNYYQTVIDKVGTTPWRRPSATDLNHDEAVRVGQVRIPVRVLKKVIRMRRPSLEGRSGRDEEAQRGRQSNEYVNPQTARFYEEAAADEETEEVLWSRERADSTNRRIVILGGPGGGKTFLTRLTAIEIAEDGLAKLRDRKVPLEELPLPIWLDLESLADAAAIDRIALGSGSWPENSFRTLFSNNMNMPPVLVDWLAASSSSDETMGRGHGGLGAPSRLGGPRCWLILDALDQVPEHKRPHLWKLLEALDAQGWKCRVVLTCRTANYTKPPWHRIMQYSLAPFGQSDIRKLITKWFGEGNPKGNTLLTAARQSYSLRHAFRSPLLVTLACLVAESKQWTAGSRRELYGEALDGLLRMLWHGPTQSSSVEREYLQINVDDLLAVLRDAAWRLFLSAPESNRFSDTAVVDALKTSERLDQMKLSPIQIRDDLVRRGVLFNSGKEDGETHYSFLHRTFLEYLAAEHLARAVKKVGWDQAIVSWEGQYRVRVDLLVKKMTWLPSWQETLIMMTAALGEDKDMDKAARMVSRVMELMVDGK